jgi:CDP-diacylglycerol--serine O-phosphatidyltransferase
MNDRAPDRPSRHRGIYLLPNLFTTGAMFAGFYAIVAGINAHFSDAAVAVLIAAVLDGLDGRVARLTHTQSEFGVQYDSLADLLSFGLAPALVMYTWSLAWLRELGPVWGKIGWVAAFVYTACTALRLARFNVQVGVVDKRYFQGLASPAAAAACMSFVWAMDKFGMRGSQVCLLSLILIVTVGLLMVSRVRYYSFKSLPLGTQRVPFLWIIGTLLILVLLAIDPPRVLFAVFTVYVLSGPIMTLWGRAMHRRRMRRPMP